MAWRVRTNEDGVVTAMVGPTTVPRLARALDPGAAWVLVSEVGPILGGGWTQAKVPVFAREALAPQVRNVRALGVELLMSTSEFLEAVPDWDGSGIRAHQLRRRPDDRVHLGGRVPHARYEAFGLTVGFDLPHAGEVAQVMATSAEAMTQALRRLGEGRARPGG